MWERGLPGAINTEERDGQYHGVGKSMNFFRLAKSFQGEETGAVTVDWVVLTAAVVGLGVAALSAVKTGTGSLSSKINNYLASQEISSTF